MQWRGSMHMRLTAGWGRPRQAPRTAARTQCRLHGNSCIREDDTRNSRRSRAPAPAPTETVKVYCALATSENQGMLSTAPPFDCGNCRARQRNQTMTMPVVCQVQMQLEERKASHSPGSCRRRRCCRRSRTRRSAAGPSCCPGCSSARRRSAWQRPRSLAGPNRPGVARMTTHVRIGGALHARKLGTHNDRHWQRSENSEGCRGHDDGVAGAGLHRNGGRVRRTDLLASTATTHSSQ